jgi:hypothetical protein
MSLTELKVDKTDKNVVKVEILNFVVGRNLKVGYELLQMQIQLSLEIDIVCQLLKLNASVVLFQVPDCRELKNFSVPKIEQNICIRETSWIFRYCLQLSAREVKY